MDLNVRNIQIPFPTRRIINLDIAVGKSNELIDYILRRSRKGLRTKVAFANSNLLIQARRHEIAEERLRDFLILNDGVALDAASCILYREAFPENLNGTDFVTKLLQSAPRGTRVFLYGALPEVVAKTAKAVEARFGLTACGYADGYGRMIDQEGLVKKIEESKADILLVALGNPKQELWLSENWPRLTTSIGLGVGAWMDFFVDHKKRAPIVFRLLRSEWLFRLLSEPRRLWRRYSVDIVTFFFLVARQALHRRNRPGLVATEQMGRPSFEDSFSSVEEGASQRARARPKP
jgi:exopolysaccharide biosynthesis WecB/TagA/CpsF family protein